MAANVDRKTEGMGFGPGATAHTIACLQEPNGKTKVNRTASRTQARSTRSHDDQIYVIANGHENRSSSYGVAMTALIGIEPYKPRHIAGLGIWAVRDWRFKTYSIAGHGPKPNASSLDQDLISQGRGYLEKNLDAISATPHYGLGFVIIHEWDSDEKWLLINWWTDGCICRRLLAGASGKDSNRFGPVSSDLMACVYELVPIDFESRAWTTTVLSGKSTDAYLERWLPDGAY